MRWTVESDNRANSAPSRVGPHPCSVNPRYWGPFSSRGHLTHCMERIPGIHEEISGVVQGPRAPRARACGVRRRPGMLTSARIDEALRTAGGLDRIRALRSETIAKLATGHRPPPPSVSRLRCTKRDPMCASTPAPSNSGPPRPAHPFHPLRQKLTKGNGTTHFKPLHRTMPACASRAASTPPLKPTKPPASTAARGGPASSATPRVPISGRCPADVLRGEELLSPGRANSQGVAPCRLRAGDSCFRGPADTAERDAPSGPLPNARLPALPQRLPARSRQSPDKPPPILSANAGRLVIFGSPLQPGRSKRDSRATTPKQAAPERTFPRTLRARASSRE